MLETLGDVSEGKQTGDLDCDVWQLIVISIDRVDWCT